MSRSGRWRSRSRSHALALPAREFVREGRPAVGLRDADQVEQFDGRLWAACLPRSRCGSPAPRDLLTHRVDGSAPTSDPEHGADVFPRYHRHVVIGQPSSSSRAADRAGHLAYSGSSPMMDIALADLPNGFADECTTSLRRHQSSCAHRIYRSVSVGKVTVRSSRPAQTHLCACLMAGADARRQAPLQGATDVCTRADVTDDFPTRRAGKCVRA